MVRTPTLSLRVTSRGKGESAGIGSNQFSEDYGAGTITINGGTVIATSGGDQYAIGAGHGSDKHNSLTFADNLGVFITENLYRSQKGNRVSDCRNNKYVRIKTCGHGVATFSIVDSEKHAITGCNYCYAGEEAHAFGSYGECAVCHLISLADDADNGRIIAHWDGATDKAVTLRGRKLSKNGNWNTLCLPFSLALDGSPLDGATLQELDVDGTYGSKQTGFDNGTLNLYFKPATSIEAGNPYIVKWDSGDDVTSPVFTGVTIANVQHDVTSSDGKVSFKGIYDPKAIAGEDKTILYMGSGNKLYYPNQAMTINSCRAYFSLEGISAGDLPTEAVYLNFGEGTTGVNGVRSKMSEVRSDVFFDLSGQRVVTPKKGLYITNGKKVVLK